MKFNNQPVAITTAVKAVLGALVALGVVKWTGEQVAYVVVALEAVFGLFIMSNVTPTVKVDEKIAAAVQQKETDVAAFLATAQEEKHQEFRETVLPLLADATDVLKETAPTAKAAAQKRVAKRKAT